VILAGYIARAVLKTWLAVASVLVLIVMLLQVTRVLARAVANHFPSDVLLALIGWGAAQNVAVIVPVSLLLGIVLALGRLYEDNELTAMAACGAGVWNIYVPVLALVVIASTALAWLSLVFNPNAAAEVDAQKSRALRIGSYLALQAGEFRSFADSRLVLYADQASPDGALSGVFVHQVRTQEAVIVAQRARIERDADQLPVAIALEEGSSYELPKSGLAQRITRFAKLTMPLQVPSAGPARPRSDALPTAMLLHSTRPADVAELQGRIALPLMALLLGVLAIPFSRLRPRQSRYGRVALAILLYFLYANLLSAARAWTASQATPAWLGAWWVHAIVLGAILARYVLGPGWSRGRMRGSA
jgi:lipopolysaccharide export system permease protein